MLRTIMAGIISSLVANLVTLSVEPSVEAMIEGRRRSQPPIETRTTALPETPEKPPLKVEPKSVRAPVPPPAPSLPARVPGPPPGWTNRPKAGGGLITKPAVIGEDGGQQAWIRITTLDREHYWQRGSASVVLGPDDREEDFFDFLNSAGLQNDLTSAHDIVVIGAASCEFTDAEHPDEAREEQRAADRARKMVTWLRRSLVHRQPDLAVYTVNLGRYRQQPCPADEPRATRWQRGTYLISVVQKEAVESRTALESLLRQHFQRKDNALLLQLAKYSRSGFYLEPVKVDWGSGGGNP